MVELMRNTPFRIMFIALPTIFIFFRKKKLKVELYVIGIILLTILSEIFTLLHSGYNLVEYSLFMVAHTIIMSLLVFEETKKKIILFIGIGLSALALIFFLLTPYSSIDVFHITTNFPLRSPIDTHQYFDLSSFLSLLNIIMVYTWLATLLSSTNQYPGGLTKRYIFIFGFLFYFCGGFFTVAFGRYIVGDISIWFEYWNKIYLPLYLLFYLTLNIGLLWKPTPSLSS